MKVEWPGVEPNPEFSTLAITQHRIMQGVDLLARCGVLVFYEVLSSRLEVTEDCLFVCQHAGLVPCLAVLTGINTQLSKKVNSNCQHWHHQH